MPALPQLQVVLEGVFDKRRFLDLIRHFIVFEDSGGGVLIKKMAGYHQFHAVNMAVAETMRACMTVSDRPASGTRTYLPGGRRTPTGRPACRRGLAHAGIGQEPDDGVLRRAGRAASGDGEPDDRRHHRPQRPGRPAFRDVLPGATNLLRQTAGAGAEAGTHLRELLQVASGGVVFTTIQKFFPSRGRRPAPAAVGPAEHRRDRRRSAPQPVRLHRRLRPAHARRPAECVVHRLHGHADRTDRREHAGGVRRLHQHLRHQRAVEGRGDGSDLLREPAGQAGAEGDGAAEASTRNSRRRPKAKRSSARRSSRPNGRRWRRSSAPRSGSG